MNANNLKVFRERKGLTQKEAAELLNISVDYLSMLERGTRTPGFNLAKRIADMYDTTIDEIFFDYTPDNMSCKHKGELTKTGTG